jgi:hypothetical protein
MEMATKTDLERLSTTAIATRDWVEREAPQGIRPARGTKPAQGKHVVILQGQYARAESGTVKFVVTVQPAALDRKRVIREINDRLAGKTPRSNTLPGK